MFLRRGVFSSLARRWASTAMVKTAAEEDTGPKVVILGAGCAGLSAADRLFCAGMRDVVVLEATDRVGGRVLSGWLGDSQVELGLASIGPASIANPVFNLAVSLGEDIIPTDIGSNVFVSPYGKGAYLDSDGPRLLFQEVLKSIPPKTSTPFFQYLHMRLQQELLAFPEKVRKEWEPVLYGMANEARLDCGGGDPVGMPAWAAHHRPYIPGRPARIKSGNSCLMTSLASRIPACWIRLNEEVTKIEWKPNTCGSKGPFAVVKTASGGAYPADFVINTIPIGVLLDPCSENLFEPKLPEDRLSVMKSLGVNARDVVHLEYAEPFWAEPMWFRLAWLPDELLQESNWLRGIGQLRTVSSNVLSFKVTGPEAHILEEASDEEIGLEITTLLRRMMKDRTLPYPRHVLVTRWAENKYCRGSFLGVLPSTDLDALGQLADPLPSKDQPVLLFAGDSTVPRLAGLIPAARLSGIREAERVLAATGMNKP